MSGSVGFQSLDLFLRSSLPTHWRIWTWELLFSYIYSTVCLAQPIQDIIPHSRLFFCDNKRLMAAIKCTKCQTVGGKDNFIGKVSPCWCRRSLVLLNAGQGVKSNFSNSFTVGTTECCLLVPCGAFSFFLPERALELEILPAGNNVIIVVQRLVRSRQHWAQVVPCVIVWTTRVCFFFETWRLGGLEMFMLLQRLQGLSDGIREHLEQMVRLRVWVLLLMLGRVMLTFFTRSLHNVLCTFTWAVLVLG